jgi:tRNA dimethylallyltransferase
MPNKIVVIVGPTGSGKTDLALKLLDQLDGEIISADSRQVYKGLDYITNKLSVTNNQTIQKHSGYWIQDGKRINLYDCVDLGDGFSVSEYVDNARKEIERLFEEHRVPIVVGGTGFYIDCLLGREGYGTVPPNYELRDRCATLSIEELQEQLKLQDLDSFQSMRNDERLNKQRLIRYLEIADVMGNVADGLVWSALRDPIAMNAVDVLYIGLTTNREMLYTKCDQWVDSLLTFPQFKSEIDMIQTVERVDKTLLRGLIIREGLAYMKGDLTLEECKHAIKGRLHTYIRSQLKWFKRNTDIVWYDFASTDMKTRIVDSVMRWYSED